MAEELYKMYKRHYFFILASVIIIPLCLFASGFAQNSFVIKAETNYQSLPEYCSDLQQTVKYLYFFITAYLSSDLFSGEIEHGQIKLSILRKGIKKLIIDKLIAFFALIFLTQILFWIVNGFFWMIEYKAPVKSMFCQYITFHTLFSFTGYYLTSCALIFLGFLCGCHFKKSITVILTYMVWFLTHYVNAVFPMDRISPEFIADKFKPDLIAVYCKSFAIYIASLIIMYFVLNMITCKKDYS